MNLITLFFDLTLTEELEQDLKNDLNLESNPYSMNSKVLQFESDSIPTYKALNDLIKGRYWYKWVTHVHINFEPKKA